MASSDLARRGETRRDPAWHRHGVAGLAGRRGKACQVFLLGADGLDDQRVHAGVLVEGGLPQRVIQVGGQADGEHLGVGWHGGIVSRWLGVTRHDMAWRVLASPGWARPGLTRRGAARLGMTVRVVT